MNTFTATAGSGGAWSMCAVVRCSSHEPDGGWAAVVPDGMV